MHVDGLAGAPGLDADDAALDVDDGAVAVVLGDPDRAADGGGGVAAARPEPAVAAAEEAAHRLAPRRHRGPRVDAPRGRAARGERAAPQLELGDRPGGLRLVDR